MLPNLSSGAAPKARSSLLSSIWADGGRQSERTWMTSLNCKRLAAFLMVFLVLIVDGTRLRAEEASRIGSESAGGLWEHKNLVAWMVTPPWDAKARGPEERVQMLEKLGFM